MTQGSELDGESSSSNRHLDGGSHAGSSSDYNDTH